MSYHLQPAHDPDNYWQRITGKLKRELLVNPVRKSTRRKFMYMIPTMLHLPIENIDFHTLLCERDVEMMVCSFKALNFFCERNFLYTIHDDGSLREQSIDFIRKNLAVRIIRRAEADLIIVKELKAYPNIIDYRERQLMALKLIDVKFFSGNQRIAYIDSDVLFFKAPDFFLQKLTLPDQETNYFNKDIANAYIDTAETIRQMTGLPVCENINAGLWVMNRSDIDLDRIENLLGTEFFRQHRNKYLLDQTLISILAAESNGGADHLPSSYDVDLFKKPADCVGKHYVGKIRHGFELEGLRYIISEKIDSSRK